MSATTKKQLTFITTGVVVITVLAMFFFNIFRFNQIDITGKEVTGDMARALGAGASAGYIVRISPGAVEDMEVTGGIIPPTQSALVIIRPSGTATVCYHECPPYCKRNANIKAVSADDQAILANTRQADLPQADATAVIATMTGTPERMQIPERAGKWLASHGAVYMEIVHAIKEDGRKYILIGGFDGGFNNIQGTKYYRVYQ